MPFPTLPLVKVWLLFFKSYPPTSHENEFRHDRHNVLYDVYEVHHVYAGVYFPYHQYKYHNVHMQLMENSPEQIKKLSDTE